MRALVLPMLLLVAGVTSADAASPKDDGMKDYVIPVGWNALLNKERKTALVIGEYKFPGRGHGKVTPLNRETEAELLAEIAKLSYAIQRPTPRQPNTPNDPDFKDFVIPVGWNALLNHDKKTALMIGEYKFPGSAHSKLSLLHADSEAELTAEISRLGYAVLRPMPPPADNRGVVRIEVIPVGWNALLNDERKTALVVGEYQREGRSHGTLRVLNRGTEAELMAEISKLGYEVQRPPARQARVEATQGDGAKELVLPIGWNALLSTEDRTADILGEFKSEGRIRSKLTLLNCDTEAELISEINLLSFTILPPAPGHKK